MEANNKLSFYTATDGSWDGFNMSWGTIPTVNTWFHVAIVRKGLTATMYIDGTSVPAYALDSSYLGWPRG